MLDLGAGEWIGGETERLLEQLQRVRGAADEACVVRRLAQQPGALLRVGGQSRRALERRRRFGVSAAEASIERRLLDACSRLLVVRRRGRCEMPSTAVATFLPRGCLREGLMRRAELARGCPVVDDGAEEGVAELESTFPDGDESRGLGRSERLVAESERRGRAFELLDVARKARRGDDQGAPRLVR